MRNETPKYDVREPAVEKVNAGLICSPDHVSDHGEDMSSLSSSDQAEKIRKDEQIDLEKVQSEPTPGPIKVARAERNGLFGRFVLISEVTEPKHYPQLIKWFITFEVSLATLAAPMGSTIIFRMEAITITHYMMLILFEASLIEISRELHTSPTITNLSAASYNLSMAIFPLWWSSFSETFGRRAIFLVSFLLFLISNGLAAISVSTGMLIAMRVLVGGSAASAQSVGAGTIADIWEVRERGHAMSMFYLGPLVSNLEQRFLVCDSASLQAMGCDL